MSVPYVLPRLEWRESPNQSARRTDTPLDLVVVHRWATTPRPDETRACAGVVDYLCQPASQVSAHIVYCGGEEGTATQLVAYGRKAWHCASFNSRSIGVECADDIWAGMDEKGLHVAARIVAFLLLRVVHQPPTWVHGGDLLHRGGFTRHYDLGAAGGGHSDPTTDLAVWLRFCGMVTEEYHRGGFRAHWGRQ